MPADISCTGIVNVMFERRTLVEKAHRFLLGRSPANGTGLRPAAGMASRSRRQGSATNGYGAPDTAPGSQQSSCALTEPSVIDDFPIHRAFSVSQFAGWQLPSSSGVSVG